MNKFIFVAALVATALAEPPASFGGNDDNPIEGGNYVDDILLRRISDILNGGTGNGDSVRMASSSNLSPGGSSFDAPVRASSKDSYSVQARVLSQDSYSSASARVAPPRVSYDSAPARRNPKPLGMVTLESPELAPVVAAFELDGSVESRNSARSSYSAPGRNGGRY